MIVTSAQLDLAISKAREFEGYYGKRIGSDDPLRAIDWLHEDCQQCLGLNIEKLEIEVAQQGAAIKGGFIAKEDGSYDVYVLRDLNPCWTRFVFGKEIFHVIMDRDEVHDMNIAGLIEAFTATIDLNTGPVSPPSVQAELMAEVAAMEFLYPYQKRLLDLANIGKQTSLDFAERYMIPRVHVEKYLSPSIMETLRPFHLKFL